jgi:hypothetical protein
MAANARTKANKSNAQLSTGPRTEAGKAASKYNRTRHGLAGKQVVIQGEDVAAYEALRADFVESYQPANPAETALVDEIAQTYWRLQRGRALEAETFNIHCAGADPIIGFGCGEKQFDTIRRYMGSIERAYHRAMAQLHIVQNTRRKLIEAPQPTEDAPRPQPLVGTPPPSSEPQADPPSRVDGPSPLGGHAQTHAAHPPPSTHTPAVSKR